jgi:hypothetical protein
VCQRKQKTNRTGARRERESARALRKEKFAARLLITRALCDEANDAQIEGPSFNFCSARASNFYALLASSRCTHRTNTFFIPVGKY